MKHIFELQSRAYQLRVDCLRATSAAGSGHPTSCLSAADIGAALFFHTMRFNPSDYKNPENDRFILSKGHAAPLLYAIWKQLGKITDDELMQLRSFNSVLEGHPTTRFAFAEAATGSLGQGLSIGVGMALSARLTVKDSPQNKLPRTFVLLGDSEMSEGSNWEAFEIASHYNLSNLIAIIDVNRLGQRGETLEGHNLARLHQKCSAFGFECFEVDGHDMKSLINTFDAALINPQKPVALLAKTIKGYGLDGKIEDKNGFHGKAIAREELPFFLNKLAERFPKEAALRDGLAASSGRAATLNSLTLRDQNDRLEACPEWLAGLYRRGVRAEYNKPSECKTSTRKAYGEALTKLGAKNPYILALDAEVKNSTFAELFEKEFPDRFIECFIAEQNMIGMAVGLTRHGWIPFASTFGAFMTRAFDQIRMAGIGSVPLRLVGSHAGVSIGQDGPSQMALEDIAMIRTIPESIIFYPCDAISTAACVELMAEYSNGISYLRTTRSETPLIYQELPSVHPDTSIQTAHPEGSEGSSRRVSMSGSYRLEACPEGSEGSSQRVSMSDPYHHTFAIGSCCILRSSKQDCCCVVAAGITVFEALKAYELLKNQNIFIKIVDCYSVKPLPLEQLKNAIAECSGNLVTVEDHYYAGGLGESIVSALAQDPLVFLKKTECLAVKQLPRSGTPQELLSFEGIDANAIIKAVVRCCEK